MFLFRATHGKVLAGSSSFASQTTTAAGRHVVSNPIRPSERYESTAASAHQSQSGTSGVAADVPLVLNKEYVVGRASLDLATLGLKAPSAMSPRIRSGRKLAHLPRSRSVRRRASETSSIGLRRRRTELLGRVRLAVNVDPLSR